MEQFKKLGWYFKKQWFKYLLAVILTISVTLLNVIQPRVLGDFLNSIENGTMTIASLNNIIIVLGALLLGYYIISVSHQNLLGYLFHNIYYQIKIKVMRAVARQDADFFTKYLPGDLMERATRDTFMSSNASSRLLFNFLQTVMMIFFSGYFMVNINLELTILSCLPLPIIFIVVCIVRPHLAKNWKYVRISNSDLSNKAMESVQHVKLIRSFTYEDFDESLLTKSAVNCYDTEKKSVLLQSIFGPTFKLTTGISQIIALLVGVRLIIDNQISIADLITFNLFLAKFSMPLFQLGNQLNIIVQAAISYDRIDEVISSKPTISENGKVVNYEDFESIEFCDFNFNYGNKNEQIISHIDLKIEKGKTLGIVGKTGSGKSTLVKQLLRQYKVEKDTMLFNGVDISKINKKSIRELVAYVPQEHIVLARSIIRNLELGNNELSSLDIEEATNMADFKKDIDFLPEGYETIVGEYGVTLSGGQKQRLSIARALLKDAPILIFDDSLSAVDGNTEANIIENLKKIRKNKTNIIVAHRLSAITHADEIIVLENGQIVERGTHSELLNNRKWYFEQYKIQKDGTK